MDPSREQEGDVHASIDEHTNDLDDDVMHSFVNIQEFDKLSSRLDTLKKHFTDLNANVTQITETLKQLVSHLAMGVLIDPQLGGSWQGSDPLRESNQNVEASGQASKLEGVNSKNLKPHVF